MAIWRELNPERNFEFEVLIIFQTFCAFSQHSYCHIPSLDSCTDAFEQQAQSVFIHMTWYF